MIEIDEVVPVYLCNKNAPCMGTIKCDDCIHTADETYALNANAVEIANLFMDTFSYIVDEDGKLFIWEKEKKDAGK